MSFSVTLRPFSSDINQNSKTFFSMIAGYEVPPLFFLNLYLCDCIYVETNLQIEHMGLGKTLEAIFFFWVIWSFFKDYESHFVSQWDRLLKNLCFERNGWLGVRDKRFTPEHEVLRYVGIALFWSVRLCVIILFCLFCSRNLCYCLVCCLQRMI